MAELTAGPSTVQAISTAAPLGSVASGSAFGSSAEFGSAKSLASYPGGTITVAAKVAGARSGAGPSGADDPLGSVDSDGGGGAASGGGGSAWAGVVLSTAMTIIATKMSTPPTPKLPSRATLPTTGMTEPENVNPPPISPTNTGITPAEPNTTASAMTISLREELGNVRAGCGKPVGPVNGGQGCRHQ